MRRTAYGAFAAAIAAIGATAPATAETLSSAYTSFDSDHCRHHAGTGDEDYGSWDCKGYGPLRVRLAAGDQRMTVTFGRGGANDDLAESQTFGAFNDVYKGTVEWRLAAADGGAPRPFATIVRWNVMKVADAETGKATAQVLVVTRLGPGGVCHVGYVDARANPDPNALARRIADETARSFRCGKDARVSLGAISPGLGLPTEP